MLTQPAAIQDSTLISAVPLAGHHVRHSRRGAERQQRRPVGKNVIVFNNQGGNLMICRARNGKLGRPGAAASTPASRSPKQPAQSQQKIGADVRLYRTRLHRSHDFLPPFCQHIAAVARSLPYPLALRLFASGRAGGIRRGRHCRSRRQFAQHAGTRTADAASRRGRMDARRRRDGVGSGRSEPGVAR